MSERKLRRATTWASECQCYAPEEMFERWENVSQKVRDLIPKNGLPCDGGGRPGPWCTDCEFGNVNENDLE